MARKKGRAPNRQDTPVIMRPYAAQVRLVYSAENDTHAQAVALELAEILSIAGYEHVTMEVIDPNDGRKVTEFLVVKEGDGKDDDQEPPPTLSLVQ